MAETKDVDLYAELKKTLDSVDESEEKEASGASSDKPEAEKGDAKKEPVDENGELTEEEISALSPRAQKRLREQAATIKELAEKEAEKPPEVPPEDKKETPQGFKNVNEFLSAVQDEPSRKLLEKFYGVIKGEINTTLAPVEKANAEAKFNEEFGKYEKIEGLADYKNDLRKTFLRNPNQSLKSLIGETVADLQLSKVKPIETEKSTPNRGGKPNLDDLSKDDLYAQLDVLREQ